MPTISQRRGVLKRLPTDLHDAFRGIITQIKQRRNVSQAELGMQVLMWIHFAYRPLELAELQHALAVEKGLMEFDADNIPSCKALLDCCLGLVLVDEETMTVRFVHYTLQEYFRNQERTEFPNGYSYIAETCLTYLTFSNLRLHCTYLRSLEEKIAEYPFLNHAARYWGTYVRRNDERNDDLRKLANVLVDHENGQPPCAIQALYKYLNPKSYIAQRFSGIHALAYFGLGEFMINFSEIDLEDESGRTPLSWAAEYGHEAVVRLLMKRDDVDMNAPDDYRKTPLLMAAEKGHEAIVQLLIESGDVDINAPDNDRMTPFLMAAEKGQEAVVLLLIQRGDVDINAEDRRGFTALSVAAANGHEGIVRLLIERDGVEINAKSRSGNTPLLIAAKNGHEAVVRLLIQRDDVDINNYNSWGNTPLLMAAESGHEALVRLLVERDDIDMNANNRFGETPFSMAAMKGHEAVVRLLIKRDGVDINAKDNDGKTPLSIAAKNGH